MEKSVDLHIHTYFSDGTFSPKEVVEKAAELGLSAIAITDHDCVEGISAALEAGKIYGIEVVPGVELTSEADGAEVHFLGLFIDWHDANFLNLLEKLRQERISRTQKMIEKLENMGFSISFDEVLHLAGKGSMGRTHLAQAMLRQGYVSSVQEAFEKYVGYGKPAYVSKKRLTPEEAINAILKVGGVPILAHPGLFKKDELIGKFVDTGLMGIEVFHSDHSKADEEHYKKIAQEYGLLISGGSDCHGLAKGEVLMGKIRVDYKFLEDIRNAHMRIRQTPASL